MLVMARAWTTALVWLERALPHGQFPVRRVGRLLRFESLCKTPLQQSSVDPCSPLHKGGAGAGRQTECVAV